MIKEWHAKYKDLERFIAEHPEIKIDSNRTRIPDSIRDEFYLYYDNVLKQFVHDSFPGLIAKAVILKDRYLSVEREISDLLCLNSISSRPPVRKFIHDPEEEIVNSNYYLFFDLLKSKITIGDLDVMAIRNIEKVSSSLLNSIYQQWVSFSLVKLLKASRLLQVRFNDISGYGAHRVGWVSGHTPIPKDSNDIFFNYKHEVRFMVPDFIIFSKRINKYLSIRSEIIKPLVHATNLSNTREWFNLSAAEHAIKNNQTFMYVGDEPEDISLVSDALKICRPDLILECRAQGNWYENEGLKRLILLNDALKPKLGTYIISMDPVSEQPLGRLDDGITLIEVGFNRDKLQPIVDTIFQPD